MVMTQLFPNAEIIGLDHDAPLLEKAKKWIGKNKNVNWVVGVIDRLPFQTNAFDKIILSEVLEHLPDDLKLLRGVRRALKPGGILAITVPNHHYPFFGIF